MAAKLLNQIGATGLTVYAIIAREADGYLLDDADGSFAAAPADPFLSLAEHGTMSGLYQASESRLPWNDGRYIAVVYSQSGGSPVPASDTALGSHSIEVDDDAEISLSSLNAGEALAAVLALASNTRVVISDLKQAITQLRLLTTAVEKRTALKI